MGDVIPAYGSLTPAQRGTYDAWKGENPGASHQSLIEAVMREQANQPQPGGYLGAARAWNRSIAEGSEEAGQMLGRVPRIGGALQGAWNLGSNIVGPGLLRAPETPVQGLMTGLGALSGARMGPFAPGRGLGTAPRQIGALGAAGATTGALQSQLTGESPLSGAIGGAEAGATTGGLVGFSNWLHRGIANWRRDQSLTSPEAIATRTRQSGQDLLEATKETVSPAVQGVLNKPSDLIGSRMGGRVKGAESPWLKAAAGNMDVMEKKLTDHLGADAVLPIPNIVPTQEELAARANLGQMGMTSDAINQTIAQAKANGQLPNPMTTDTLGGVLKQIRAQKSSGGPGAYELEHAFKAYLDQVDPTKKLSGTYQDAVDWYARDMMAYKVWQEAQPGTAGSGGEGGPLNWTAVERKILENWYKGDTDTGRLLNSKHPLIKSIMGGQDPGATHQVVQEVYRREGIPGLQRLGLIHAAGAAGEFRLYHGAAMLRDLLAGKRGGESPTLMRMGEQAPPPIEPPGLIPGIVGAQAGQNIPRMFGQ